MSWISKILDEPRKSAFVLIDDIFTFPGQKQHKMFHKLVALERKSAQKMLGFVMNGC